MAGTLGAVKIGAVKPLQLSVLDLFVMLTGGALLALAIGLLLRS